MALNFPNSPTLDQVYEDTTSGFSFKWDGTVWKSYSPTSFTPTRLNIITRSSIVSINFALTVYGRYANTTILGDASATPTPPATIGIQSGGIFVGTGITTLNFIGAGNTFAVGANSTMNISISGSSAGSPQINDLDLALFD